MNIQAYDSRMDGQQRRDVRITTLFTEAEISELDGWISEQRFPLPRSEAIRFLIRQGLVLEGRETKH